MTKILLQKRGFDSVISFLLGYFNQTATNLEGNTSHGRKVLCFLGRTEKSLENMKYSQTKLRPESYMKEMDYVMKTRSCHTILGLWETICPPVLQSNLYQHEVYARFLERKSRKHLRSNSLSEVELSRYRSYQPLQGQHHWPLSPFIDSGIVFWVLYVSPLCCPHGTGRGPRETLIIQSLKCWNMAATLSVAMERGMVHEL